ncbi:MAG: NAD(P)-dependent alcohol dehydrogenase [Planctomycetes bacterium]|jgi:NADPH:quinone reductase-like Zn-dependent oxidoreductase|nr:NAD(P)-dependent alcohol dehydrogenase [Planctomycetota bacterium]MCL4730046.1 NAD(P)-dependent alcohol dehydrogenase [Planctomycetota bacterium]
MRQWQLESGKLTLSVAPDPVPGPGEVLVRLDAWALNYRDLMILRGEYGTPKLSPLVPLSDAAGEVVATGPGTDGFKVGARVMPCFLQRWIQGPIRPEHYGSDLGFGLPGTLCELRIFPTASLTPVPPHLSPAEAATLPCAGVTAFNALRWLQPGQTVLTLGTGGVSIFALQLAKALGARVIITSRSDEKLAWARALGADHGINYHTTPEWDKEVLSLCGGANLVVETGGAKTFQQSLNALAAGGTLALLGRLTGITQGVNVQPLVYKAATLRGIYVGSRDDLAELAAFMTRHNLKPVVDQRVRFDEAARAFQALAAGPFGKVVITA